MLISELGSKEEKSQAAMTGQNIGWISLFTFKWLYFPAQWSFLI